MLVRRHTSRGGVAYRRQSGVSRKTKTKKISPEEAVILREIPWGMTPILEIVLSKKTKQKDKKEQRRWHHNFVSIKNRVKGAGRGAGGEGGGGE